MKINESNTDRVIRVVAGAGIISLVYWGPHSQWGWVGLIPLITGLVGYCPFYAMFDVSSKSTYAKKF